MTTDLLDLARRTMAGSLGLDGSGQATPPGDDHSAPDVRTDPRGEEPPGPRGGDLLAVARSFRTGDATDTGCAISAIRGKSPSEEAPIVHPSLIAQPDGAGTARLSPARSSPSVGRPVVVAAATPAARRPTARGTTDHHAGTTATTRSPGSAGRCRLAVAGWEGCGPARPALPSMPSAPPADRPPVPPCRWPTSASLASTSSRLPSRVFGDDIERVITVIDPADPRGPSVDRCAISARSAKSPDHGRHPRGDRLREKREKREKGVLDTEPIPLFGEDVDGSDPSGTPA